MGAARRWKGLVVDREFIGGEWFRFLKRKRIKRAIRIREVDIPRCISCWYVKLCELVSLYSALNFPSVQLAKVFLFTLDRPSTREQLHYQQDSGGVMLVCPVSGGALALLTLVLTPTSIPYKGLKKQVGVQANDQCGDQPP